MPSKHLQHVQENLMTHYTFYLDNNLMVNAGLADREGMKTIGYHYVEDTQDLLQLIELLQSAVDVALTIRIPDNESSN